MSRGTFTNPTRRAPFHTSSTWANLESTGICHSGLVVEHPAAFVFVLLHAAVWLFFDREHFDFNAVATLAVWIMTLLIQRANRRDTLGLHAKLDELLRVDTDARSEFTRLDEKEPEEIEVDRDAEVKKPDRLETLRSVLDERGEGVHAAAKGLTSGR
jgi:low affinity Fe/Cu permease